MDQPVRKVDPFFFRNPLHQILFDMLRILAGGQPEQFTDPRHVRIDDNTTGNAKRSSQQDIGRFSTNTGQGHQLRKRLWQGSSVLFGHSSGHSDQVFGFIAVKARRADDFFQFILPGLRKILCRRVSGEESRGHQVDAFVRTLCRKDRRDQKLKWRRMIECTKCDGVSLAERTDDTKDTSLFLGGCKSGLFFWHEKQL